MGASCHEVSYMGAFCHEVSYVGASCVMRCHTWVLLVS